MWRLLLYCATLGAVLFSAAALKCSPECQQGTGVCTADHGNLSCECITNWSGEDCSTFICDTTNNPCLNDGVCVEHPDNRSQYLCACPLGFAGDLCQYTTQGSECDGVRCSGHGTCYVNSSDSQRVCICDEGFWGQWCGEDETEDPDPCDDASVQHCFGHGKCIHINGTDSRYDCVCDPGWNNIENCKYPLVDQCFKNPCNNGGMCVRIPPTFYRCECPAGFTGVNCTIPFNVCTTNGNPCQNGGICEESEGGHYFTCSCPPGHAGPTCEGFVSPCSSPMCENGGVCVPDSVPDEVGVYSSQGAHCDCPCTYSGELCENESALDPCGLSPCQNGGNCSSNPSLDSTTYSCSCLQGYAGQNCESVDYCGEDPCGANAQACINHEGMFLCVCKEGWGGSLCSLDIDECAIGDPCNGGSCTNNHGGYICDCPPGQSGVNCEVLTGCLEGGGCSNGGQCEVLDEDVVCVCPPNWTGIRCEIGVCPEELQCSLLADNNVCDLQCFNPECGYDGVQGNCFTPDGKDPWANCSLADHCRTVSNNGQCNVECNFEECLYDAYECVPAMACSADLEVYCQSVAENGVCDEQCNTALCPSDFKDCNSERYAEGNLVLILFTDKSKPFESPFKEQFLDDLSTILHTRVVVIYTEEISISDLEKWDYKLNLLPPSAVENDTLIYMVTLRLDNQYCREQCTNSADEAVAILQAYYSKGGDEIGPYGFADAYSSDDPPEDDEGSNDTPALYIVLPILLVAVVAVVLVAVVILGKRRRVVAKLWRPNSPTSEGDQTSLRGGSTSTSASQAGAVVSTETASISHSDSDDYIAKGAKATKMENSNAPVSWVDVRVPVSSSSSSPSTSRAGASSTAVVGQAGRDARQWNNLHYDALRNPELFQQLLDQYRVQNGESVDVNAPGPSGYTPLMLAVMKKPQVTSMDMSGVPLRGSSSSDSSGDSTMAEHASLLAWSNSRRVMSGQQNGVAPCYLPPIDSTVPALISAGCNLDAASDLGHTALHLAAAHSQGEYVRQLLAGGADPNVQDNWAQSPIHAAIGASAEGAFSVLLNHSKTNLNLKCDGGLTPLMLAVKQCNQRMVKQLIKKNVDITATDSEGRTAVHWSAVLNNLETLKLLIRQGPDTIKDQQDNKGQTPLFLACREGHLPSVKHLLDCFANATLLDSLDRSPLQIAYERQHQDVVEMLRTSAHGPFHFQSSYSAQPHHVAPQYPFHHHLQHPHGFMYPSRRSIEHETSVMQSPPMLMSSSGRPSHAMMKLKQPSYGKLNGVGGTTIAVSSPRSKEYNYSHFYLPPPSSISADLRYPSTTAQNLGMHPASSGLTTSATDIPLRDLQATDPYLTAQQHTSPSALHSTSPAQSSSFSPPTIQQQQSRQLSLALGYPPGALHPSQEMPTPTTGYGPVLSTSHHQPSDYRQTSPPSTTILAAPEPQVSYAVTSSSGFSDLNIASVVDSLAPPSSAAYSNPQVSGDSKVGVGPSTSCYEVDDPTLSLNDIEPTFLTSMPDDLTSIAQTSVPGYLPPLSSSANYMPQGISSVGYGGAVPGTTANGYSLPESSGLVSSSYCQTAYNCHDCTQSVPSGSLQPTLTYVTQPPPSSGSTRPLQHLPMTLEDPALQRYQTGGTGNGNGGTPAVCSPPQVVSLGVSQSPPSYYPSPPSLNELPQSVAPPLSSSHCHADPPSLTPSPENREEQYQQDLDQIMTESFVIGQPAAQHQLDYSTTFLNYPPHHFIPHAPRSSSRLGTIV